MSKNRLLYSEYLRIYEVEQSFIDSLNESGLIRLVLQDDEKFIEYDDLSEIEQFVRWHYDLNINVEGIEALHHILGRVKNLQAEIRQLNNELKFYKSLD
ncbi:MAG: chaperone modulator CbpM [Dysgonamonadaceae bacterium]|jgi:hypothetical protein|nr:chaperone modulator CbpM [Dysgonamonadaceae bacterium]